MSISINGVIARVRKELVKDSIRSEVRSELKTLYRLLSNDNRVTQQRNKQKAEVYQRPRTGLVNKR